MKSTNSRLSTKNFGQHHKKLADRELSLVATLGLVVFALCIGRASASDWGRFHGADGSGVSSDLQHVPIKWSDTENLKWKPKLPGPGSSSPIVIGPRVFVTCWTGYGVDRDNATDQKDLRRYLISDATGRRTSNSRTQAR
jgi:hypothetical protein